VKPIRFVHSDLVSSLETNDAVLDWSIKRKHLRRDISGALFSANVTNWRLFCGLALDWPWTALSQQTSWGYWRRKKENDFIKLHYQTDTTKNATKNKLRFTQLVLWREKI